MKEKHYRVIEQMLNEFKNKKLNYSDFIDKIFELEIAEEFIKRKKYEFLEEIKDYPESKHLIKI